jgi:hypothetical protein
MAGLSGPVLRDGEPAMKKIPDSSRRLSDHVLRALNQIRKPSTAGEITELLYRLVTGTSAKVAFPGDTGHAVLWRFVAANGCSSSGLHKDAVWLPGPHFTVHVLDHVDVTTMTTA